MSIINIYRDPGSMVSTPLGTGTVDYIVDADTWHQENLRFLESNNLKFTKNIAESDLIVSQNARILIKQRFQFGSSKKYLLWTAEPRFDLHFTNKIKGFFWFPDIHIMNVYTGDIFTNNFSYPFDRSYWDMNPFPLLTEENCTSINRKIVAIMGYRDEPRLITKKDGKNIDLYYLRSRIALKGHQLNMVDIYGGNWPEGVSIQESRKGDWQGTKAKILQNYDFNFCFENTTYDYYCTEKIWDSIRYGCLPIYYGQGNKIYEDFPKNSFLDYCDFENAEALFEKVNMMSIEEYRERMNRCVEVLNTVLEKRKSFDHHKEVILTNIVKKIYSIMET